MEALTQSELSNLVKLIMSLDSINREIADGIIAGFDSADREQAHALFPWSGWGERGIGFGYEFDITKPETWDRIDCGFCVYSESIPDKTNPISWEWSRKCKYEKSPKFGQVTNDSGCRFFKDNGLPF